MKRNIPNNITFNVLTLEQKQQIHEASLRLLEEFGVKVSGERMLQVLCNGGAKVHSNGTVKFPRKLVEDAIRSAPKEIVLYNRDGNAIMTLDQKNNIYFGSIAEQLEYLDYKTNLARPFMRADIKTMATLQDYLDNISFVGMGGLSSDIPTEVACQIGFIDLFRNFTKVIQVVTSNLQGLKDIIELCVELAGSKEALQKKPLFFCYAEPIPPFMHVEESNERLLLCAEYGIPFTYMPYSMMGGTSPITSAAALVNDNAEVLAGLVMSQLARKGTPYVYGAMPSIMDMKSTVGSYGAPEFAINVAAAAELADYYGLPFYGTAGVSDAKTIDPQSISEMELTILSSMMSKANMVHDVGMLDHAFNISPMAIYLSNEIIDQAKSFVKGIEINEETFLLDVTKEVGPGGNFLCEESTLDGMSDIWYPALFTRPIKNPDQSTVLERAQQEIDHILATHKVPPLDERREAILKKYEQKWLNRTI